MKRKQLIFLGSIIVFITLLFFHKFFFFNLVPFPGDFLIHDYSPWKYYSYLGYNPGSYPSKFQYFDVIRQMYPWKIFVIESIKNGQVPLWNPYTFSGSPLLANLQSQVFTPFNLLYFIFPYIYSWSISLILQIVFALLFTYLYARRIGLELYGALFAAIAYSCSLYMSVFFQYGVFGQTILWLPLILYGIEGMLTRFSVKEFLVTVAGITFAAFGGHLQIFSYVLGFTFIYAMVKLFVMKKNILTHAVRSSLVFVLAMGLASIQLVPALELIQQSARTNYETNFFLEYFLLKPHELILLFSPDFYGNPTTNNFLLNKSYPQTALYIGILPLLFAISAVFLKRNHILTFFLSTVIVLFIGITNNPISVFFYSLQLPVISASAPTNAIFLIGFSLSILAGYGFDHFILKKNKFVLPVGISLGGVLAGLYLFHYVFHVPFSNKNALYSLILVASTLIIYFASRFIHKRNIFVLLFILLTIFDLFYFFQKFNSFVPPALVYPKAEIIDVVRKKAGIDRVWGYGHANISSNVSTVFSVFSPEGYDPLYPKNYGKFIYASRNGKLLQKFDVHTRSDAVINSAIEFLPEHPYAFKILNALGVKFIIDRVDNGSTEELFPSDIFRLIHDQDGWKIYENTKAAKRVFLTNDYAVYHSDQEFEKRFFSDGFDPSQTVLLETEPGFTSEKNDVEGDLVTIQNYNPNEIKISVKANKMKLLFLSDMYYPGWKAYVNDKETEILRANYTFRAITVPEGESQVRFVYEPQSFFLGMMLSLISFGILFVVSCVVYMRK